MITLEPFILDRRPVLTTQALAVPASTKAGEALRALAQRPQGTALLATDADGTVIGQVDLAALALFLNTAGQIAAAERDSARQALAQTQAQATACLANLSHEVRTPLSAISGYAELMLSGVQGEIAPPRYRRYVQAMHEASGHIVELLENVLQMTRIGLEQTPLMCEEVDLAEILGGVADMMRQKADAAHMKIHVRVRRGVPKVHADPRILRQILINLVSNATKYAESGTTITLTALQTARGDVRLEVRDRGAGIPPEAIQLAMQPYVRLHDGLDWVRQGTGLGLALVKSLAELHDGTLQLVSAPGEGTRAIVTIPSARVREEQPRRPQREFEFVRVANRLSA
jgi:signal transduction histidine kinase